jgi:GNAT superfamily N-acetyltransferase
MRTATYPTQLQFHDLAAHFLALSPAERFLRFGWAITDAQIVAYVESLLAMDDCVFVVVEPDRDISGVLHLESMGCGVTVGLSVSAWARKMGIGTLLLRRAAEEARARGLKTLFARNLNLNAELRRLALRLGMNLACAPQELATSLGTLDRRRYDGRADRFDAGITLADDSLRSQWNGVAFGAALRSTQRGAVARSC